MNQSDTITKALKQMKSEGIINLDGESNARVIINMVYSIAFNNGQALRGRPRPVVQLNRLGYKIKDFDSGADAGRKLGINKTSINQVCRGKRPTAGGFKFAYKT